MSSEIVCAVPVLPASDVRAAVDFYVQRLGFTEDFCYGEPPGYGGVSRDGVQVHLCAMNDAKAIAQQTMLRFRVRGVDALFDELKDSGTLHPNCNVVNEKPWGTREFTVLDLDGVCVTFYEG